MRAVIEIAAQAIEVFAVAIIVIAIVDGTVRYLFHINQKLADAYVLYKVQLWLAD